MSYVSYTCLLSVYAGMCVSVLLFVFFAVLANECVHLSMSGHTNCSMPNIKNKYWIIKSCA